jgi:hypothetical protein
VHANPHVSFVQVALPFAGTAHTVHEGPQALTSFAAAHLPLHAWNSGWQVNPHWPCEHVVSPFATSAQAWPQPPQ